MELRDQLVARGWTDWGMPAQLPKGTVWTYAGNSVCLKGWSALMGRSYPTTRRLLAAVLSGASHPPTDLRCLKGRPGSNDQGKRGHVISWLEAGFSKNRGFGLVERNL